MHTIDTLPVRPVDVAMGHHWTSTQPTSHFMTSLMCVAQGLDSDGTALIATLTHEAVTIRRPGHPTEHRAIAPDDLDTGGDGGDRRARADQHQARQRVRIIAQTPGLAGGVWANTAATQEVLSAALAEYAPKPEARVAAAATMGALVVALLDWGARDDDQALRTPLLRALDVLDPPATPGESR